MTSPAGPVNRLARESSPYLRLHAHNPVDWYPWGPEALTAARDGDKPIFLSIGYSTCYWCHVMERESFSNPAIAAAMNRSFVNIKIDREERPDLDEIYMLATQILTGQGGWPNSVFLTPKLEPYFAGTYFPPTDAHGRPGFPTVLESMERAFRERRSEVEEQAAELAAAIRGHLDEIEPSSGRLPGNEVAVQALDGLRQRFDATWGGFGQQPKFPTPANLWLLEESVADPAARMMLGATLGAMARGGLFDQLGGGFHRYATDREWRVPHFEKMLYDNGLLLELYAREAERTGDPEPARIALATAEWLRREMTSPEGAFWSAIDAETDGDEGAYYVWNRAEIDAALGTEDAEFLAPIYGFAGEPFFDGGRYVLHLPRSLEVAARQRRTTREQLLAEIEPLGARLLERRGSRPRPATDDKILADWNGMAIAGLATAGRVLGRAELTARAAAAADFLLAALRTGDGTLMHAWRAGKGRVPAFLSDYVFVIRGLLLLHRADGEQRWLDEALRLVGEQERRLASPRGGFFNAAADEDLLQRAKEVFDGAVPAANAVAALNSLELAEVTGDGGHLQAAERTLRAFAPIVTGHPDGARSMTIALSRWAAIRAGAVDSAEPGAASPAANLSAAHRGRGDQGAAIEAIDAIDSIDWLLDEVAVDGGFRGFVLRLRIADGWHLAVEDQMPRLETSGALVARLEWPAPEPLAAEGSGGGALLAYSGLVEVRGTVRIDQPDPVLILHYLACGEGRCLPAARREVRFG